MENERNPHISVFSDPSHKNISQFKEKWLTKIGYVSQEVKLFDETILNNLTMFDNNYNDKEKINNVLKVLKLDTFVSSLPRKLETIIGSEGIELSVGQKQRIGIARAIYKLSLIHISEPTRL